MNLAINVGDLCIVPRPKDKPIGLVRITRIQQGSNGHDHIEYAHLLEPGFVGGRIGYEHIEKLNHVPLSEPDRRWLAMALALFARINPEAVRPDAAVNTAHYLATRLGCERQFLDERVRMQHDQAG